MDAELLHATALENALSYARRGWPVFPVNERKEPLTPHGFHDATRDEVQITAWWTRYPEAGVAVPTGQVSGLVVRDVDIDAEKKLDGPSELARLISEYGSLPPGPRSRTGRGGSHLFFQHQSKKVPCSNSKIAMGLYVKGDGGSAIDSNPSVLYTAREAQVYGRLFQESPAQEPHA